MSCPQLVQQLWDAVKVTKYQQQKPTLEKIAKYMCRAHAVSEEEVSRQLQNCVRDGLLFVKKTKVSKGSKLGVEQEGYRLPDLEEVEAKKESHDWYCFKCHTGGDVIPCQGCYRVYHMACANNLHGTKDKYICAVCQSCEEDNSLPDLKLYKLNRLLSFVCSQLKDKYSALINANKFLRRSIFVGSPGAQVDISTEKESWRVGFLIYEPIDLGTMMSSAKTKQYRNLSEFIAHAQSIVHAVVIFHGDLSELAVLSRQMLRECLSEISQLQACPSCYESSILRPNRHWFCKPCRPPHKLIFAGSPYMPAKVLQETEDKLDVVFFGPEHIRARVDRDATLPITTPVGHLGKTSDSWSRAMVEFARHQKELASSNLSSSSDSDEGGADASTVVKERLPVKVLPPTTPLKSDRFSSGEEEVKKEVVKRKRGRPPKTPDSWPLKRSTSSAKLSDLSDEDSAEINKTEIVKRKRGRPPKKDKPDVVKNLNTSTTPVTDQTKRRPGRPRKKPEEEKKESEGEESPVKTEAPSDVKNEDTPAEPKEEPSRAESPTTTVAAPSTAKKNEEEIVSSSCIEPPQVRSVGTQTNKKEIIAKLKEELDEVRYSHAEEVKALKEAHALEIAATKKKQWCYNCEREAIYHCCWNTAYCSTECQQVHWQGEHKRVCRRKR